MLFNKKRGGSVNFMREVITARHFFRKQVTFFFHNNFTKKNAQLMKLSAIKTMW